MNTSYKAYNSDSDAHPDNHYMRSILGSGRGGFSGLRIATNRLANDELYKRLIPGDNESESPMKQTTRDLYGRAARESKRKYTQKKRRRKTSNLVGKRRVAAYCVGESIKTRFLFNRLRSGNIRLQPHDANWGVNKYEVGANLDIVHASYLRGDYTTSSIAFGTSRDAIAPTSSGREDASSGKEVVPTSQSTLVYDSGGVESGSAGGHASMKDSISRLMTAPNIYIHTTATTTSDGYATEMEEGIGGGGGDDYGRVGRDHHITLNDDHLITTNQERILMNQVDIFFFPEGTMVFWGCEKETEEFLIIQCIEGAIVDAMTVEDWYEDDLNFTYSFNKEKKPHLDMVHLNSIEIEEKLAVSFALGQSVKLQVFEDDVEAVIAENADVPQKLAELGSIGLTKIQISKRVGRLFITRSAINLRSELLDTPEYFWETDAQEPKYHAVMQYMDVSKRIDVINTRLEMVHELLQILSSQREHAEGSKLEWIVIILIFVEILAAAPWSTIIRWMSGN